MLDDKLLEEIRETCEKASPGPWEWGYDCVIENVDDPEDPEVEWEGFPVGYRNIQLKANGEHRFWVEMTDTQVGGDLVFDFDFIRGAREWVPALLAEIDRLRSQLGKGAT